MTSAMKALRLLENAVMEPDQLALVCQAFDAAWDEIKSHYQSPTAIEAARLQLANAVLAAYRKGMMDIETLKASGLTVMRGPRL